MRLCLVPRSTPKYGQDYRQEESIRCLDLKPWGSSETRSYPRPEWGKVQLIISFNSEDTADAEFVRGAPMNIPVVVHHQLRRNYLCPDEWETSCQTLKRATLVVVPAAFLGNELGVEASRIRVVSNGADSYVFRPRSDAERETWREELRIPKESLVAGFIGSPTTAKGGQIIRQLATRMPEGWKMAICSKDSPPPWICGLHDVVFCQQNTDQRNRHPTPLFDVLLSLSLCEVAPMVVVEALLSGVQVVATQSTPYLEQVRSIVPGGVVGTVPLPLHVCPHSRKQLTLTDDDAMKCADSVRSQLVAVTAFNSAKRAMLAGVAVRAGLTSEAMLTGFKAVYDEVASSEENST